MHLHVDMEVTLNNACCFSTIQPLVGNAPLDETSSNCLEALYNISDESVALLFKLSKHTSTEEDLSKAYSVPAAIQVELLEHEIAGRPAFKIASRHVGAEDFVARPELSKGQPVRKPCACNSDALKNTVASQLVEHKRRAELLWLLFVIRQDTANEVRVRAMQLVHQCGKLLLVPLRNSPEEAFLYPAPRGTIQIVDFCAISEQSGNVLVA